MTIPRVRLAVGPDTGLPAHPAPAVDFFGAGVSNVSVVSAATGVSTVHKVNDLCTLVQLKPSADTLMLVGGSGDISASGFPLTGGGFYSYAVPAGAEIAFQAVADASTVNILEG